MSNQSSKKPSEDAPKYRAVVSSHKAAASQSNPVFQPLHGLGSLSTWAGRSLFLPAGNQSSKNSNVLMSYVAACQSDPEFQPLHATVHATVCECHDQVIKDLDGDNVPRLSFHSLKEVTRGLHDINQNVMIWLQNCDEDIWKDRVIFDLVEEYYKTSLETLKFCNTLQKCARSTKDSLLKIQVAIQSEEGQDMVDGKKYSKTLEELEKFKKGGDPFTEVVVSSYDLVYKKLNSLLDKLRKREKVLDGKENTSTAWRKAWNVLCVAAVASIMILSVVTVVTMPTGMPPLLQVFIALANVLREMVFKTVNSLWEKYEKELNMKRDIVRLMRSCSSPTMKELQTIRILIDQFEVSIKSHLGNANLASLTNENAVKRVIDAIKTDLNVSEEGLQNLIEHAIHCSRVIENGMQKIVDKKMSEAAPKVSL